MLIHSVIKYAIVTILVQYKTAQGNENQYNNIQTPLLSLEDDSSLITDTTKLIKVQKNVTSRDKLISDDKIENREFPPSARRKRYSDNDYYDYEISAASNDPEDQPECILTRSEFYLAWWVHENGTLKLPSSNRSGNSAGFADLSVKFHSEDALIKQVIDMKTDNPNDVSGLHYLAMNEMMPKVIRFMSIANNELHNLPVEVLILVNVSLQYLSLANNDFDNIFIEYNETFQSWTAFPIMNNLKELDLRNCSMSHLEYNIFDNLLNLEKLFLSHNFLSVIPSRLLAPMNFLNHLDLSYNSIIMKPTSYGVHDPFSEFLSGLIIEEDVFLSLPHLIFLDLSHSKLKKESVLAFSKFREKLEQLSLCYTDIPLIFPFMFNGTSIKVLDLSGNTNLNTGLSSSWFGGLENRLEILIFKSSYIKNILPLKNLKKLRMLDLGNNNINQISSVNFNNFPDLEILDLSINHISNWYEKVFERNVQLKILNLRNNNINLMTPEMMVDFNKLKFLAIGGNSFVCDCSLREFIERAAFNAKVHQCKVNKRIIKRSLVEFPEEHQDPKYHYDVLLRKYYAYISHADISCKNIIGSNNEVVLKEKINEVSTVDPTNCDSLSQEVELLELSMYFNFLLLDYNENDYHCIESDGLQKRKILFIEIIECEDNSRKSSEGVTGTPPYREGEEEEEPDLPEDLEKAPNVLMIIYISVGAPLTLIIALWYWKRKDIKYFCTIFKNTLILSLDKEDKKTLMMTNRRKKSNNQEDNYIYDVFVSYCDKDREWVLDHLIPNIEKRSEVTICLHERDFQVGLSILENIIQCMDQSRCLLLVISESFLKSNWCSFEMHLAQHRLIETRRDQLILVLLQDIPKSKRPRTLNFLMRTKTYIMWPNEDKKDLRNIFWKRLRKSIILNNWDPENEPVRKPRHSIV